ncbi:MAG TPA: hypothetical protein VK504_12130 [Vicinamibacterales bacterium]|jgi:hypothetical protein|nr:hypothetical protein [Vicinamibacterales bacterium]
MVDALCRTRGWLRPDGRLIDLRPAHTIPEVVIGSADHATVVGVLAVEAERHERHAAADKALDDVLDRRLFVLEESREFVFLRYADSAEELRDHIAQKWRQTRLDGATCLRTAAALSDRPGARLWLRERVAIRRLVVAFS